MPCDFCEVRGELRALQKPSKINVLRLHMRNVQLERYIPDVLQQRTHHMRKTTEDLKVELSQDIVEDAVLKMKAGRLHTTTTPFLVSFALKCTRYAAVVACYY